MSSIGLAYFHVNQYVGPGSHEVANARRKGVRILAPEKNLNNCAKTPCLALIGMALGVFALIGSETASALNVGAPKLDSRLAQALDLRIPLKDANLGRSLGAISARLLPAQVYPEMGLDYPVHPLDDFFLEVKTDRASNVWVHVESGKPIKEPILILLLEVRLGQEIWVRQIDLLLDPPIRSGLADAGDRTSPHRAGDAQSEAPFEFEHTSFYEYGPVRPGETLSQIAQKLRPSPAMSIADMSAVLRYFNPAAFFGGRDELQAGERLRVPHRRSAGEMDVDVAADKSPARVQAPAAARPDHVPAARRSGPDRAASQGMPESRRRLGGRYLSGNFYALEWRFASYEATVSVSSSRALLAQREAREPARFKLDWTPQTVPSVDESLAADGSQSESESWLEKQFRDLWSETEAPEPRPESRPESQPEQRSGQVSEPLEPKRAVEGSWVAASTAAGEQASEVGSIEPDEILATESVAAEQLPEFAQATAEQPPQAIKAGDRFVAGPQPAQEAGAVSADEAVAVALAQAKRREDEEKKRALAERAEVPAVGKTQVPAVTNGDGSPEPGRSWWWLLLPLALLSWFWRRRSASSVAAVMASRDGDGAERHRSAQAAVIQPYKQAPLRQKIRVMSRNAAPEVRRELNVAMAFLDRGQTEEAESILADLLPPDAASEVAAQAETPAPEQDSPDQVKAANDGSQLTDVVVSAKRPRQAERLRAAAPPQGSAPDAPAAGLGDVSAVGLMDLRRRLTALAASTLSEDAMRQVRVIEALLDREQLEAAQELLDEVEGDSQPAGRR